MKRIFVIFLMFFVIAGCSDSNIKQPLVETDDVKTNDSVKSIWITYYELQKLMKDDESDFETNIKNAFSELKRMGFNTITVQVRPFADAFYYSSYFPTSSYCVKKQGSELNFDPLKIMCSVADNLNLHLEAWINPYRVSNNNDIDSLCDDNIAKKWYNNKSTKSNVYIMKNGIYFNPASKDVVDLIVNGVVEIVQNYNVYAIHFDDYFYPSTNKKIDKKEYSKYQENGGDLSLDDWRRDNVNNMVKSVYSAIKKTNKNVLFGISPAADIENNYKTLYADVDKWSSENGYVDYICPQIYFGFKNETAPFMFTTKKWCDIAECDLYIGLPLYKANTVDEYALSGKNEFINNCNIIARQIQYLSKLNKVKGYYVFSYSSLFDDNCKAEVENMLKNGL